MHYPKENSFFSSKYQCPLEKEQYSKYLAAISPSEEDWCKDDWSDEEKEIEYKLENEIETKPLL